MNHERQWLICVQWKDWLGVEDEEVQENLQRRRAADIAVMHEAAQLANRPQSDDGSDAASTDDADVS